MTLFPTFYFRKIYVPFSVPTIRIKIHVEFQYPLCKWWCLFSFIFYFRQGCGGGTTPGTASSFGSFGGNDADQEDNVDEEIDEKSPKLKGLDEADEYGKEQR